jgi:hypothetical protein
MFIDALLEDCREMLVTGIVESETFPKGAESIVSTGLWPPIGIHVGMKATVRITVNMGSSAKNRGGEGDFYVGMAPVLRPFVDEFELTFS